MLIACRNGEATIANAVRNARKQCPVFVVSDGSSDATAEIARAAGAEVLALETNVGKPAAIHREAPPLRDRRALRDRDRHRRRHDARRRLHRAVPAPDERGVAIVVGKTLSDWRHSVRWIPWVETRAFGYWKYQLFIRRGQSLANVMNCISGSNSMYRTDLLMEVAVERTPYIVDDTYWTLETHRRKLGRKATLFDAAYIGLMIDWVACVVLWPDLLGITARYTNMTRLRFVATYFAGYALWAVIGPIGLRKWRLALMFPALVVVDRIQRVNFAHAFIRTVRQPVVESCTWASPTRYTDAPAADLVAA